MQRPECELFSERAFLSARKAVRVGHNALRKESGTNVQQAPERNERARDKKP